MREVDQLLAEMLLEIRGHDEPVHQDVIDGGRPQGAGITKVVHLNRRRPQGHDLRPGVVGVAFEIHQNVDGVGANACRGVAMGSVLEVHERVERVAQTAARGAPVVGSIGVADHAKSAAVVQDEELGDEVRGGMLLEIRRKVPDGDAVARRWNRRASVDGEATRPLFGALALLPGRGIECQKHERIDRGGSFFDGANQLRGEVAGHSPVAQLLELVHQERSCLGVARI